jgi:predicted transcriptional regulator
LIYCSLKNRSKTDIVGLILEVANVGGDTKTKIMYKAFLSYSQLKEYLAMLMENSLLEFEEERLFYRITEKGIRFLQMYAQVHEMMPIENA